ncbi:MAG: gfo/Idh/MocA family oxidoreductase, partial [Planctomycetia bacterium]|nr:gfo/Idh/MocA family oxidoreductase [Planctomycetia bacterium]
FLTNRFHFHWRWFWDHGSGELGAWGSQLLDVARWGLNIEWPQRVCAVSGQRVIGDEAETPDSLHVQFEGGDKTIVWEHRTWSNHAPEGRTAGVAFFGERGTLVVDRGGWKVYGQKDAAAEGASELLEPHLRNFIDCIRTRAVPVCPLETGHVSSALCHLGNIAYRIGRSMNVDPRSGAISHDADAERLARVEYRSPWTAALA